MPDLPGLDGGLGDMPPVMEVGAEQNVRACAFGTSSVEAVRCVGATGVTAFIHPGRHSCAGRLAQLSLPRKKQVPDDLFPVPSALLGEQGQPQQAAASDGPGPGDIAQQPRSQTPETGSERPEGGGGGAAPRSQRRRRGSKKRAATVGRAGGAAIATLLGRLAAVHPALEPTWRSHRCTLAPARFGPPHSYRWTTWTPS